MADMNQITQLINSKNFLNVSQETFKIDPSQQADFLALLKDMNANSASKSSATPKPLDTLNASSVGGLSALGTEALVRSRVSSNPVYRAIDTVNNAQIKSDKSAAAFAAGYGDELQVAIDISRADKYLKFFSEVRTKLVNGVKELARTQI